MKHWLKRFGCGLLVLGLIGLAFLMGPDSFIGKGVKGVLHKSLVLLKLEDEMGEDQVYWCPMHPEIRKNGIGTCPI